MSCGSIQEEGDFSRLKWIEAAHGNHQYFQTTAKYLRIIRNATLGDESLYEEALEILIEKKKFYFLRTQN